MPDEREIERAMGALRPIAPAFDTQVILARAVRAGMRKQLWLWRGAAGALAASLALAMWPHLAKHPGPFKRVGYVPVPAQTAVNQTTSVAIGDLPELSSPIPGGDSYLAIRQRVLRQGMNGIVSPETALNRLTTIPSARGASPEALPTLERVIDTRPAGGPIDRLFTLIEKGDRS